MSGEYAWQGRAEDNEAHLRLTFAEDAKVREVWERAAAARPGLDRMMRDIRDQTQPMGSQLPGDRLSAEGVSEVDFSLKGLDSLRRKVAKELGDKPNLDVSAAVADMKDLNRYTLTFEPETYTQGAEAAFQELRDRGFEPIKMQNTWTDPVYKGINSVWEHKDSQIKVELQLHTPDSFRVKTDNHRLFELARSGGFVAQHGEELGAEYVDAANHLMNERYQQAREVGGKKLPIEIPPGHERLAKPFNRAELSAKPDEQIVNEVRRMAGEPQPTQSAAAGQKTASQGTPLAQAAGAHKQSGTKTSQDQGTRTQQSGAPGLKGIAQQRSVAGRTQPSGPAPQQGGMPRQGTPPAQQSRGQGQSNGRSR